MMPSARLKRAPRLPRAQSMTGSQCSFCRSTSALRRVGAIAEQIRRGKAQDVLQHRLRVAGDAVDGGVDQAHHRHRHRIDGFALRRELVGDQSGRRFGRQRQQGLARRPAPACRRDARQSLPSDAARPTRPCRSASAVRLHLDLGAAHRIRIGELLARFEIVEDITHASPHAGGQLARRGRLTMIRPAPISAKRQEDAHAERLARAAGRRTARRTPASGR